MDLLDAKNRLRTAAAGAEGLPSADRDAKLRAEVRAVLLKVPRAEQAGVLDGLSAAFPVWPADVPPPKPPTDLELVEQLAVRAEASDVDRRRIEGLMRSAGLAAGMSAEAEAAVRDKLGIDPATGPEVGRIVEGFLVLLGAMGDADQAVRAFLQEHSLAMMMVGTPRVRESALRLLTVPDADPARHARRADLEAAATQLVRAIALLCHWPGSFADDLAVRLAPARIEATIPAGGRFGGKRVDFEKVWQEYRTRVGGRSDESNVKAELLGWMAKVMRDTI